MTSSRPNTQKSSGKKALPPSRRSARQQRLANRESNRQLSRAGTRGSGGGDLGSIMLWTVAAVVIGIVVIGGAWLLTQQPKKTALPSPIAPTIVTPADLTMSGRTLGRADAPVTVDVYSDFQCPNCLAFTLEVEPQVVDTYVRAGKVKIVYHDFIVMDANLGGTESLDAANASLCAADQGKFWQYHDWLFGNQGGEIAGGSGAFTKDRLKYIGAQIGLNAAQFNQCVDSGQHNAEINDAQTKIPSGLTGTPSILVNAKLVVDSTGVGTWGWTDVKKAIDAALNPSASPSPSASASASPSASASASAAPTASPS